MMMGMINSCLHGIAFAELVAFLEDMKSDEDSAPATEDEYAWLRKVKTALENSTIDGWISWSDGLPTMLTCNKRSSHHQQSMHYCLCFTLSCNDMALHGRH